MYIALIPKLLSNNTLSDYSSKGDKLLIIALQSLINIFRKPYAA